MTPLEATKRILAIDAAVTDLKGQIAALNQERVEIIIQQGQAAAKLSIGDEVTQPYGHGRTRTTRRYRITRIGGWFWSPRQVIADALDKDVETLSEGEFTPTYYGKHIKADGTLADKEKKMYDVGRD